MCEVNNRIIMTSRNKNPRVSMSPNRFKNRRTSLNVNLSYVSSTSLITDDENIEASSEKTVIDRKELPVRRNLSLKRSVIDEGVINDNQRNNSDVNTVKIKPSFVRMVRISTSTPVSNRNAICFGRKISQEDFTPSENTKRSSVLEDVRFPLDGEIFSPSASIVMETSMDITEVQGRMLSNTEPVVSEMLNACPGVHRGDESSGLVEDTEDVRSVMEDRRVAMIIPDSEQDSFNTIRTSLNVNTSLDSRFSSIPNNSLYDPRTNGDIFDRNRLEDILPYPASQSSDGNLPTNSILVTTAVIEHRNTPDDVDRRKTFDDQTTIDLGSPRESHRTSLQNGIQSGNNKSLNEESLADDSSATEASSSTNPDHTNLHLRLSNDDNTADEPVVPDNLPKKPIRKGKKKLMRLRMSEVVDLSPVSTKIVPARHPVLINRGRRRNKTAKKIEKKEDKDTAKRCASIYTSDDDIEEDTDPKPKKEKRVRKLRAKKITIKKKANVNHWKEINGNINAANESCDDISSALGRTSLDDFEVEKTLVRCKNRKIRPKIIIVVTGLPIEQKLFVKGTVTTLGSAKLDKIVTRNTTHVVSKGTRTVNLLRGIVRGCWLVSFEWISKSREAGKWVDPEEYEIDGVSKAVKESRKEKQLFGAAYVSELFLTCGSIHVKEETSTPAQVLKELVRIAGGRVAAKPEEAKIIIGRGGFKEIWILDSIANGEIQPLEMYCKKKCLN